MEIKMIVSDLDGTLLNSKGQVSDYTVGVLNACREKGIRLAFATARPWRVTHSITKSIEPDFIIADNGAMIFEKETVVFENHISPLTKNRIIKELLGQKEVVQIAVEAKDFCYTSLSDSSQFPVMWKKFNLVYSDFKSDLKEDCPKISVECTNRELLPSIIKKYSDLNLVPNSGENWWQIVHKDASKINGIRFLCSRLSISLENVAAFGDDYNDIEMIKNCGAGVAMLNAIDEVKACTKFVCGSNDADGAAKWLERNIF